MNGEASTAVNKLLRMINRMLAGEFDKERFSLEFPDLFSELRDDISSIDSSLADAFEAYSDQVDMFEENVNEYDKRNFGYIDTTEMLKLTKEFLIETQERVDRITKNNL